MRIACSAHYFWILDSTHSVHTGLQVRTSQFVSQFIPICIAISVNLSRFVSIILIIGIIIIIDLNVNMNININNNILAQLSHTYTYIHTTHLVTLHCTTLYFLCGIGWVRFRYFFQDVVNYSNFSKVIYHQAYKLIK